MMRMRHPDELLYDSEASLRLVDHAIGALDPGPVPESSAAAALDASVIMSHVDGHVERNRPDFQTLSDQQLAEITRLLAAMRSMAAQRRPA